MTTDEMNEQIEHSKDVQLSLLQDLLNDVRDQRGFFKKLCIILCSFVFTLIVGFIGLGIHNQHILKDISKDTTALILQFLERADVQIDTSNIEVTPNVRTDKEN